ncbi:MAG: hypothetical protein AB7S41_10630 [Parvibaculaceae bacterium]
MSRLLALLSALCLAILLAATPVATPAHASVYDSNVIQKLKLSSAQRAKIRPIVAQGSKEFRAILRKHKINPNAKPEMSKLMNASNELIAHRRKQRSLIKPILTPEQLDQYDDIMDATAARVRKAAN